MICSNRRYRLGTTPIGLWNSRGRAQSSTRPTYGRRRRRGIVHAMQGVTTAIIAFIFLCIAFPHFVKHKAQFYAALVAVLAIILLDAIAFRAMVDKEGPTPFGGFAYLLIGLLQIIAITLLILSAGGLTARELAGEVVRAYEVIRRGEEEKTVIIPLTGKKPKAKGDEADEDRVVFEIDPKVAQQQAQAAQPPRSETHPPPDRGSLPVE
jgi:hypothetical protein